MATAQYFRLGALTASAGQIPPVAFVIAAIFMGYFAAPTVAELLKLDDVSIAGAPATSPFSGESLRPMAPKSAPSKVSGAVEQASRPEPGKLLPLALPVPAPQFNIGSPAR